MLTPGPCGRALARHGIRLGELCMTDQFSMFIVTDLGTYHLPGAGLTPHLIKYCTGQCQPAAVFTAMGGSTVKITELGRVVGVPAVGQSPK